MDSALRGGKKAAVVLATQRSGSTLLCEQLSRRGIGLGDEHILEYLDPSELLDFSAGIAPRAALERFNLSEYMNRGILNGSYCTKLMSNYLPAFCAMVAWPEELIDRDQAFKVLSELFRQATFILVWRSDRLAQAISRLVAADTGICHRAGETVPYVSTALRVQDDYNSVVVFSYRRIKYEFDLIDKEEAYLGELKAYLCEAGSAVLDCIYRESHFCLEPENQKSSLSLPRRLYPLTSSLRKTSTPFNDLLACTYCICDEILTDSGGTINDDEAVMAATLQALDMISGEHPCWAATQSDFISAERYL